MPLHARDAAASLLRSRFSLQRMFERTGLWALLLFGSGAIGRYIVVELTFSNRHLFAEMSSFEAKRAHLCLSSVLQGYNWIGSLPDVLSRN